MTLLPKISTDDSTKTLKAQTPTAISSSTPTLQDFLNEARNLGQEAYAATLPLVRQQAEAAGEGLSRKLYGQNIGLESGLGTQVVEKTLKPILESRTAYANELSANLARNELDRYYDQDQNRLNTTLQMVQSGNYTPNEEDQAYLKARGFGGNLVSSASAALDTKFGKNPTTGRSFNGEQDAMSYWQNQGFKQQVLQKYGLNPKGTPWGSEQEALDYIEQKGYDKELARKYGFDDKGKPFTNESDAIRAQEEKDLQKLKGGISDPTVRDRIGSKEEYYRYLDSGRTDEDQIAEIAKNAASLQDWQRVLPILEQASVWWDRKISAEAMKGDSASKGQLDYLMLQKNQIDQWIADTKAGKAPSSRAQDIASSGSLDPYLQQSGGRERLLSAVNPGQSPQLSANPNQTVKAPVTVGDMGYGRTGPIFQSWTDLMSAFNQYKQDPEAYVRAVGSDPFKGTFGFINENGGFAIAARDAANVWKA